MKLHTLLKHTQESLFDALMTKYPNCYFQDGEYILVPGDIPIMLVAHLDTVHDSPPSQICTTHNGNILMSPQGIGGDDRCGVYALMKLEECSPEHHPWLLFTCDEESGCSPKSVNLNTFEVICNCELNDIMSNSKVGEKILEDGFGDILEFIEESNRSSEERENRENNTDAKKKFISNKKKEYSKRKIKMILQKN